MAFNQPLAGKIEPDAPSWRRASAVRRKAFYREAGAIVLAEKKAELRRAIGANGRAMKPRKRPRRDGADGPVLIPHEMASRTARLMAFRAWSGGLTLFWHGGLSRGQRTAWGTILGYHADGKVRGAPKRDVRLSTRGISKVRKAMAAWWAERDRKPRKAAPKTAPEKKGVLSKAQEALVKAHGFLKGYLRPKGKGF